MQKRSQNLNQVTRNSRDRMMQAIISWGKQIEDQPGWKEWRRDRVGHTLFYDETSQFKPYENEFKFPLNLERQHDVIFYYLRLVETTESLKECEFYFRRYPFRGLPVTRHGHLTNICEMYFGRFYEFKERLKNHLNAVNLASSNKKLEIGPFIKLFEKVFEPELRERHGIHHRARFEDIAIDRIFLTGAMATDGDQYGWCQEHRIAYRKVSNEWAMRVRQRSVKIEEFLEAVATGTLNACNFLAAQE